MADTRSHWLNKLQHLNPNRSKAKGAAPHKPCLLLCLLDMAQDGELVTPELRKTPGLRVRFNAFSSIALPRWGGKVDLSYPFFYLRSQGLWQPLDKVGNVSTSVDATECIQIDPEFFALMHDADFRRSARIVQIETYFPPTERIAFYALLGVKTQKAEFQKELQAIDKDVATDALKQGRSARFGVQVVCGYHHTCALTGYRIITASGESVVEAAHIEPWAKTRNDDIHNGLALSRNAHWAFDRGLWSVDDDFRILAQPKRFEEWGPDSLGLMGYRGRILQFAPHATLRPHPEYLRRHRQQWVY
ncbi:MAG: HNH endonuclease [Verrucomicrobiaceae bacterium]|nr:HNH endonuclease [Verrucomicrobiaceae bacterium]